MTQASSGVMVAHFDADMFALDGLRRVDGHLIVGGVAVFDAQIVIIQIHVEK